MATDFSCPGFVDVFDMCWASLGAAVGTGGHGNRSGPFNTGGETAPDFSHVGNLSANVSRTGVTWYDEAYSVLVCGAGNSAASHGVCIGGDGTGGALASVSEVPDVDGFVKWLSA